MKTKIAPAVAETVAALLIIAGLVAICALSGCATIQAARVPHRHLVRTQPASAQAIATTKATLADMQAASAGVSFTFPAQH